MENLVVGEKYTWGVFLGLKTTYTNYGTIRRDYEFRRDKTDGNGTPKIFRLFKDEVPKEGVEVDFDMPDIKQKGENKVTDGQLEKLKKVGYNPRKEPYNDRPTVSWALEFIRNNYGIAHITHTRHFKTNDIRFSLSHIVQPIDARNIDLSEGKYDDTDGIIDTLEELESSALDFSLDFILDKGGRLGYWKWVEWNRNVTAELDAERIDENKEDDTEPPLEV